MTGGMASRASPLGASGFQLTSARAMSVETIKLESLGDSITTAVLLNWTAQVGDYVGEDDVIGVVETDKVTMDIRSKQSGVITAHLCSEGDEIDVGADIYNVDTAAAAPTGAAAAAAPAPASDDIAAAPAAASAGTVDIKSVEVPIMGESITTGSIAEWHVAVGDYVDLDQGERDRERERERQRER
eukprot:GSChrysophyteH2.ASY1.ANO1.1038.1 assembled CDS